MIAQMMRKLTPPNTGPAIVAGLVRKKLPTGENPIPNQRGTHITMEKMIPKHMKPPR